MVLIQSEQKDLVTDKVIEWLYYYGIKDIVRINEDTKIVIERITPLETIISLGGGQEINLNKVSFFWYRRGNFNYSLNKFLIGTDKTLSNQVERYLLYEWQKIREYIYTILNSKPSLGNYYKSATNKLINLKIASKCGLKIPNFTISERTNNLIQFGRSHKVITKPIGEIMPIKLENGNFNMHTKVVDINKWLLPNDHSFPNLLQSFIKKEYEIRTFILRDKLYSMAIYSQSNNLTKVDYRNYDLDNMNRMIPYQLPKKIVRKLLNFMKNVKLDTGSVDMIKSTDGDYYFLEVNPAGNIEMVSDPCNYNIEKEIAELIINEKK